MIYDCFSFFNELDILEIRLNTLNAVVDRFVLVETTWTHAGQPKELIFQNNKERFRPFLDKIIHIVLTDKDAPVIPRDTPAKEISWFRENTQRNAILRGLADARPTDVVIISDLDEIPNPDKVRLCAGEPEGITNFAIRNYSFWLNNANVAAPYHYLGPKLCSVKTFLDERTYENSVFTLCAPQPANPLPSATLIRFARANRTIKPGGWHFSSQGGLSRVRLKINNMADNYVFEKDLKQDIARIEKTLLSGGALDDRFFKLYPEPLEHDFPEFLKANRERFADQLLPTTEETWRKQRFARVYFRCRWVIHAATISLLINVTPKALHPFCARIRKVLRF